MESTETPTTLRKVRQRMKIKERWRWKWYDVLNIINIRW